MPASGLFVEFAIEQEPGRDIRAAHQRQETPPPGQGVRSRLQHQIHCCSKSIFLTDISL